MRNITLTQLKENQKAKVLTILGGKSAVNKLMSMGIYAGKEVVKLSHIGLRGPVVVKTGRSILALGHGVSEKIIVEI